MRTYYFSRALGFFFTLHLALAPLAAQSVQVDPTFAPQLLNDVPVATGLSFTPLSTGAHLVSGGFTLLGGTSVSGFARLLPDGTRDPAFAATFPRYISCYAPLPDGRLIAVAYPNYYSNLARLERLLADGTPDSSCTPIDLTYSYVNRLVPQPDGRILVVGNFSAFAGFIRSNLVRLHEDGTIDLTFDAGPKIDYNALIAYPVVVQPDGKILYSSYGNVTSSVGPGWIYYLLSRLNADGSPDTTFGWQTKFGSSTYGISSNAPYHSLAIQPDGKIVAATDNRLIRLNSDGSPDPTFAPAIPGFRRADQIAALADGRLVVQARVSPAAPPLDSTNYPARISAPLLPSSIFILNPTGAVARDLRTSFPTDASLQLLAVQPDGHLLLNYGFPFVDNFSPPVVDAIAISPTSSATTAGSTPPSDLGTAVFFPSATAFFQPTLARIDSAGVRDTAFAPAFTRRGDPNPSVTRLSTDSAGRIYAYGSFTSVNGAPRPGLARFLPDGSLDLACVPAPQPSQASSVAYVQSDGKIILRENILGQKNADGIFSLVHAYERLLTDGSRDTTFNSAALPISPNFHAVDSAGRLLVSGFDPDDTHEARLKILLLNSDGSRAATLSTTFSDFLSNYLIPAYPPQNGLFNPIGDLQPQPDGKFLVAATVAKINALPVPGFARLNADGTTDPTYHPATGFLPGNMSRSVSLLPGGRVLYYQSNSYVTPISGIYPLQVTTHRLLADGSRDPSFISLPGTIVNATLELSDGKLLSADGAHRWLANGLPDLNYSFTFTASGGYTTSSSTAAESAGRIYLGGFFATVNGQSRPALARLVSVETSGFTVQPKTQTVVAGRTAILQAVLGTSAPATYQWTFNATPLAGATGPALVLRNVRLAQAGDYRLVATVGSQTFTSAAATLTVTRNKSRLINFSARSRVPAASAPQIAGFVLRGTAPRALLLRSIGQGLTSLLPTGTTLLPKPVLQLRDQSTPLTSTIVAENTGGISAPGILSVAQRVGAFALPNTALPLPESVWGSALSLSLPGGVYSAHTLSGDGRPGLSLFEFYDATDAADDPFVANISIRARTAPGDDVLIAGFVVSGNGPQQLLVRAAGPELARYGVTGALADPQLTLFDSSGAAFAMNDNWGAPATPDDADAAALAAAAQQAGAFALSAGSRDAALLVTLEPGIYTVQADSADSTASGEVLLEIYALGPPQP